MARILKGSTFTLTESTWTPPAPDAEALASASQLAERDADAVREQADADAAAIRAAAEQEAEAIRAGAREEGLEAGRAEGFAAGHAEGRAQGAAEARSEVAGLLEALRTGLEDAHQAYDVAIRDSERDLVRLALAVAERVLHTAAHEGPAVQAMVRAALELATLDKGARVLLSPLDAAHLGDLGRLFPPGKTIAATTDPAVGAGGCLVETPVGRVDARLATQFAEVVRTVLQQDPSSDPLLAPAVARLSSPTEQAQVVPRATGPEVAAAPAPAAVEALLAAADADPASPLSAAQMLASLAIDDPHLAQMLGQLMGEERDA